jgi:cytoskeletal protein CcmA (bactofilin family)
MWKPREEQQQPTSRAASQPPVQVPVADPPRPVERRTTARIGQSVAIKGEVSGAEDLVIEGRVEGTINLPNYALIIGPGATIQAALHARTITISGAVTGQVKAMEKVDIRQTGSVDGDVQTPRLAVQEGAVLRGRVETAVAAPGEHAQFAQAV